MSPHLTDEVSEASFMPACQDAEAVLRDLVNAGFVIDPAFVKELGGIMPKFEAKMTDLEFLDKLVSMLEEDSSAMGEADREIATLRTLVTNGGNVEALNMLDDVIRVIFETDQISRDKDGCGIEFDLENIGLDYSDYSDIVGYNLTSTGVPYIGGAAGGDWELPVFFALYYDGTRIRLYVPKDGNCYNTDTKTAFGNDEDTDRRNIRKRLGPVTYSDTYKLMEQLVDIDAIKAELNRVLK